MSEQHRSTITRRRALKSGGLAALAAGLIGGVRPDAASAAPPDLLAVLTRVVEEDESFTAWMTEWRATDAELATKEDAAIAELLTYVPVDRQFDVVKKLPHIIWNRATHEQNRTLELMIRHMPGLEPVLRLVVMHAWETAAERELRCGSGECWDGMNA